MGKRFYPGVLYPPGEDGLSGVHIPGVEIVASGASPEEALTDAAEILQELIDQLADRGEEIEGPADPREVEVDGGQLVLLPAFLPVEKARFNVMMDANLVRRIDAVTSNRSAFLASAARRQLAADRAEA